MKITPFRSHVRVVETFTYKDVTIEAGYLSNGATLNYVYYGIVFISLFNAHLLWILAILLFVVRTPFFPSALRASVVHDYLTDAGEYSKADRYFLEILLEDEDVVRAYSKWMGVKTWHFITRRV